MYSCTVYIHVQCTVPKSGTRVGYLNAILAHGGGGGGI